MQTYRHVAMGIKKSVLDTNGGIKMTNISLFSLGLEFYALQDLLESEEFDSETGEEINREEELEDLYNNLSVTFEQKLNDSHRYCLMLDGEADVLDKEIKRLQAKKKAITNNKDRLKSMMLNAIKTSNQDKIKTELYVFSVRKSEVVNILDEEQICRKYMKATYKISLSEIKKDIKDGVDVAGAEIVKNESLNIK